MRQGLCYRALVMAVLLLLLALVPAGCGRQEVTPVAPVTPAAPKTFEPVEAAKERQQPERDPFLVAAAEIEWETAEAVVVEEGRDPFLPLPNVEIEDVKPEEPPVIVEPTEPDDPGENGTTPGMASVRLVALERCWLEVLVDGERELRTNLPRGEAVSFEGKEVRLEQVGREWALMVTLNGRNLGVLKDLVPDLQRGPLNYDFDGTRVRVTLGQRYSGGVLVGVNFTVVR